MTYLRTVRQSLLTRRGSPTRSANDPVTFGLVVAIIAVAGVFASYVPARRATRVDRS
jgi:ABC-type antimicrobial peptide transport system permease subunit